MALVVVVLINMNEHKDSMSENNLTRSRFKAVLLYLVVKEQGDLRGSFIAVSLVCHLVIDKHKGLFVTS